MSTDLIKIQLHKFTRSGEKRHHWQVMLHWDGCGSVALTEEMTRKKDAVRAYTRLKRVGTNNAGRYRVGKFFHALDAVAGVLSDGVMSCYPDRKTREE